MVVKRASRGLTEDDFLFWVVSPADSVNHDKLGQLLELLGEMGFERSGAEAISVAMGEGRKDFFPYSLYPLLGERLEAGLSDERIDLWVGVDSASERAESPDPRRSNGSRFDLTGMVISTSALKSGSIPLGNLWRRFPQIVKLLGGVYGCGLTDELSNITMNVAHHFEKLEGKQMPSLAGLVVVVPESSQEMVAQLERAAAGTEARFELDDGYGTLWSSEFPLAFDENQWGQMFYWITDSQIKVKAGGPESWPTWIGRTNADPASFDIDDDLADSLKSWGAVAAVITEEQVQLENCGFASEEDLEAFVADGLNAAKSLASALDRSVFYSPLVARPQTLYPQRPNERSN